MKIKVVTPEMIDVPQGMMDAAMTGRMPINTNDLLRSICQRALAWQSNNPRVPSDEEFDALQYGYVRSDESEGVQFGAVEWQRRMYLKPTIPGPVQALATEHDISSKAALAIYEAGRKAGAR